MPAQLLQRLRRFLDQQHAQRVMTLTNQNDDPPPPPPVNVNSRSEVTRSDHILHWPANPNFGRPISNVQCVIIHEISGWPSYQSASNFEDRYSCQRIRYQWIRPRPATATRPARPGHWANNRGYGPQYFVDSNGTAFTLIGLQDLAGPPLETWHGNTMNSFALGIENSSTGDSDEVPIGDGLGARWWRLSDRPEDLIGRKVYLLLHPRHAPDALLIWIAQFPQFTGSGDIEDGNNPSVTRHLGRHPNWKNMLFTERDYRTLALLSRLLAEHYGIPRNFPLLPYLDYQRDGASAALFRKLLLSDQQRDQMAAKLVSPPTATNTNIIDANQADFRAWYDTHTTRNGGVFEDNRVWRRFFEFDNAAPLIPSYKGFLSHAINSPTASHHDCPGPLFDWHRFAREVWDWWWYPFDLDPVSPPRVTTNHRPYRQARLDTELVDYYYDATGIPAHYDELHPLVNLTERFRERFLLPDFAPIYAIANGVVVAARFPISNSPTASGFLLVRHEVFHQTAANHRINYDAAPTFVWSLIYFLSNPNFRTDQIGGDNPDWLDRFVMRLRECELAVAIHNAANGPNPATAVSALVGAPLTNVAVQALRTALNQGWNHPPSGPGPRLPTGQEIESDAAAYRGYANDLIAGRHVLFPREANPAPTPVRVILGDFLGFPNRMPGNQTGIQIEIFSNDELPVPGRTLRATSASTEDWWREVSNPIWHETVAAMILPADGVAWHYGVTDFLNWINGVTWVSEWEKYGTGNAAPPRPLPRRVT